MTSVASKDGTRIAYERLGDGPPAVLVDGAFCHRGFGPMRKLANRLAPSFTVFLYDRRGRGGSGDTPPYDVAREIEDLDAVVRAAGGGACLFGASSGAVLAARAAAAGVPVRKVALYEPPLALDGTHHPQPPDFTSRVVSHLKEGRRGDAVKLFLRVVGVPPIGILFMRLIPGVFSGLKRTAHTLPYDFAVLGDTQRGGPMPAELRAALGAIRAPVLCMAGGKSPAYMKHAAKCVAEAGYDARLQVVPGQQHVVSAKALAPLLARHFA